MLNSFTKDIKKNKKNCLGALYAHTNKISYNSYKYTLVFLT